MTDEPLRVGIIGTGSIAQSAHIPAWARVTNADIVAIADPSSEARERSVSLLEEEGIQSTTEYPDADALLANEAVDLVDVTIPPGDAKERTIRTALASGCHVTCQKPFLDDYTGAKRLVQLANEHERVLSVNQQARFAGAFSRVKDLIDEGKCGPLRTIKLHAEFDFSGQRRWLNFSVHSFDLIRYWAGREPTRVIGWHKRQTDTDNYLFGVWLDFDDVLAVEIWDELSSSTRLRWAFRVMGDAGTLRGHEAYLDDMHPPEIIYTPRGDRSETKTPITSSYVPEAFRSYFDAVISSITGSSSVPTSGKDNLRNLQLAHAAKEAAELGEWVDVTDDPMEYEPRNQPVE